MLLCIAHGPGVRLRDIAARTGVTERTGCGIVTDLTEAVAAEVLGFLVSGRAPAAAGVQETESALVRGTAHRGGDGVAGYRLAGGRQPLFPFAWVLRRTAGAEEQLPAAQAAAVLGPQKPQAGLEDPTPVRQLRVYSRNLLLVFGNQRSVA